MEKKTIIISVALAVRNEEANLDACLASIRDIADEIVVVDGGSGDKTKDIARRYGARIIRTTNPPIFHINKQKALDACRGTWILQLDADEVIPEALKNEIRGIVRTDGNPSDEGINGYYIPRKNYFWGHFMKKGGQYPDYVLRLVRAGYAEFPCKSVHEQIRVKGTVGYLKEPMLHYSYRTLADYWKKADAYTTLTAMELKDKRTGVSTGMWLRFTVLEFVRTFFLLFVRHKGFMDGLHGFVFAVFSALHYPIAYRKYTKMV